MEGVGEEGRDSGSLKERVKLVVVDGGVVGCEELRTELCFADWAQLIWGRVWLDMMDEVLGKGNGEQNTGINYIYLRKKLNDPLGLLGAELGE